MAPAAEPGILYAIVRIGNALRVWNMMQPLYPRKVARVLLERIQARCSSTEKGFVLRVVGMCITHLKSGNVLWHSAQIICYTLLTSIHELVQVQKCQPRREGKQWPDVPFIEAILKRMLQFSEFAIVRMQVP